MSIETLADELQPLGRLYQLAGLPLSASFASLEKVLAARLSAPVLAPEPTPVPAPIVAPAPAPAPAAARLPFVGVNRAGSTAELLEKLALLEANPGHYQTQRGIIEDELRRRGVNLFPAEQA
ncbi:hypothetical protein [Hymenobacter sp. B81]|uniref:hypothetical protein n=1 Tax=Hymenobacter sp. B81 TaxID=3344878 RepID=UPI0037DCB1BA